MPCEGPERIDVPEPRGLVRGQCLDDAIVFGAIRHHTQGLHVLVDPRETGLTGERRQAALHQVLLAGDQIDGTASTDEVGHEGERVRGKRHGSTPGEAPPRGRERWTAAKMAVLTSAMGNTKLAKPALATAPGMPQTTLETSSCTSTVPPDATTDSQPPHPSLPMPVNTTASRSAPKTLDAEWKSTSTEGREKLTRGP